MHDPPVTTAMFCAGSHRPKERTRAARTDRKQGQPVQTASGQHVATRGGGIETDRRPRIGAKRNAVERSLSVVKLESAHSCSAGGESVSKDRHAEGGSGRIRRIREGGIRAAASRIGGTIRGIRKADEVGCCGSGTNARIRELADAAINPRPDKGGAVAEERAPGHAVVATDP